MTIYQPTITGSTTFNGPVNFTQQLNGTASWANNLAGSVVSASFAATASSADNLFIRQNLTASNALVTGNITAQTLVVSTISSSVTYSSGSNIFGNNVSNVQQFTGSLRVTGSGDHYVLGGNFGIGSNTFDGTNPEKLSVLGSNINTIVGRANVNTYTQLNIQNTNNGVNSSADVVATNDTGNESGNYIDMGINGSAFAGLIGGPNDAYIYSTGSNLLIGNITRGVAQLKLFSGNDATEFPIIVTGSTAIMTGSLLGTASFAITASYALSSAGGGGSTGRLLNIRYLTTGSSSYAPTSGTTNIVIEMVGGGGGGGGADNQYACGAGGGAGAYIKTKVSNISDATTYTISIGTSGSGGAAGVNGSNGGNTTFTTAAGSIPANTTFTAGGGFGGDGSTAGKVGRSGGRGGIPTNGDIAASGGPGEFPLSRASATEGNNTGAGGSSPFGGGGFGFNNSGSVDITGSSSIGYGGGGGGAYAGTATGARGGNGGFGVIVVYEYT